MSTPIVWGLLPKAQNNSSTIDSDIATAVKVHNDDPNAHNGIGQSLDVHRTNSVIDHPAGSVVADKHARQRTLATTFESLASLSVYGGASPYFGVVRVYTTALVNAISQVSGSPNFWSPIDWSKEMYLRVSVMFDSIVAMSALFGVGVDDLGDNFSGFGFRVINGVLQAYHANDPGTGAVFTTIPISGYVLTVWHVYEVFFSPVFSTLTFKIDGVQVAQFTSGFPVGLDDNAMLLEIVTTQAVAKTLYASDYIFQTTY